MIKLQLSNSLIKLGIVYEERNSILILYIVPSQATPLKKLLKGSLTEPEIRVIIQRCKKKDIRYYSVEEFVNCYKPKK